MEMTATDPFATTKLAHPRLVGATIGVASAAIAIAVGHLLAGLVGSPSSPLLAVGAAAIDATPEWLKAFAIRAFGTADKTVLVAGIGIVLFVVAVVLGMTSIRRPVAAVAGLMVLGAIGVVAAISRPAGDLEAAVPAIAGTAAGLVTFALLRRAAGLPPIARMPAPGSDAPPTPTGFDRRRFLTGTAVVAGLAASGGFIGNYFVRRADATVSRAAVRVPSAVDAAPLLPTGVDLDVSGLDPFITPNDDFYRVDTALIVPSVTSEAWSLSIHGMVDRPMTLTFGQLLARPLIERDITLTCISNEVGGRYIGNARWTGVRLDDLLAEAGVQPGASQLVSRSVDGFTTGTPTSVALDGRDAMLAVAMNGEPLPLEHGFPVRMVVPGLYGYGSACKWIAEIEVTTFEAYSAYWVKRGWAEQVLIETSSRIDVPRPRASLTAGSIPIAGIAWAQHRGISMVEVQIDGGDWVPARLGEEDTIDTWRRWVYDWNATPGSHTITVRATDGTGSAQEATNTPPFPDGATGLHSITVEVA
jgi:DMSO/TMAO reductase YedYZ molybdopterin-dependent catalytic subunit